MLRALTLLLTLTSFSVQAGITIGAYNIRNFDYDERAHIPTDKPALAKILTSLRADILSVEEINNKTEFNRFIAAHMPGYATGLTQCGGAHGQHLGFLFNTKTIQVLGFTEDLSISDPGKPGTCNGGARPLAIGIFRIRATGQKFIGLTAHLKSGSDPSSIQKRTRQWAVIKQIVANLKARTGIKDFYLAGDLNTTEFLSRGIDYQLLNKMVRELGMVNLSQNSACSSYWWGGTDDGIETPSLLDHIIVTPGLLKTRAQTQVHGHCRKVSCRAATPEQLGISFEGVSDHCPITATIQ